MKGERKPKSAAPARYDTEIVSLEEIVRSAQPGLACGDRDANASGIRQIRMNSFGNDGQLDLNGSVRIPSENINPRYYLKDGDLVFNNTNSYDLVGRAALVKSLQGEPVSFSNHITRIRLDENRCVAGYVSAWIQHQWSEGTRHGRACDRSPRTVCAPLWAASRLPRMKCWPASAIRRNCWISCGASPSSPESSESRLRPTRSWNWAIGGGVARRPECSVSTGCWPPSGPASSGMWWPTNCAI